MKHLSWLLLLVPLLNLQCGYHLSGHGRNLPATAKTIAIPEFKNETTQVQAGHFVTDALREEFIKRSRLRLNASMDKADLVLEGRITAFEIMPISHNSLGAVDQYEVRITLNISLIDMKKNELFFEGTGLVFRKSYETAAADFFSQEPDALNDIAAEFSSSIVSSILDNF
jgi:curli biogenesis system outer membrane secretion channel CsgG